MDRLHPISSWLGYQQFLIQVEHIRISANTTLVKAYAEEFFMSGEHAQLSSDCAEHVCREGVDFLLGSQYVECLDLFAKVVVGSGMGEEHSGAVSDFCFAEDGGEFGEEDAFACAATGEERFLAVISGLGADDDRDACVATANTKVWILYNDRECLAGGVPEF